MSYVTLAEIEAQLPPQFILEALDDDGDGTADPAAWDKVASAVAIEIDGTLGQRFAVPFATIPAIVSRAAQVFALEMLYQRRGIPAEANPWTPPATRLRDKLDAIAKGDEPLTPDINRANPSVTAVSEPAKSVSSHGHLLA